MTTQSATSVWLGGGGAGPWWADYTWCDDRVGEAWGHDEWKRLHKVLWCRRDRDDIRVWLRRMLCKCGKVGATRVRQDITVGWEPAVAMWRLDGDDVGAARCAVA